MKLIKLVSTLLSVSVLAACSLAESNSATAPNTAANVEQATQNAQQEAQNIAQNIKGKADVRVEKLTGASKSVVYSCLNRTTLSATYSFQGDEAKAVNLVLGKGKNTQQIPTLVRDESNRDFVSFKSDEYLWSVENGFNLSNATTKTGGNLTKRGAGTDEILAKLCKVNNAATRILNK